MYKDLLSEWKYSLPELSKTDTDICKVLLAFYKHFAGREGRDFAYDKALIGEYRQTKEAFLAWGYPHAVGMLEHLILGLLEKDAPLYRIFCFAQNRYQEPAVKSDSKFWDNITHIEFSILRDLKSYPLSEQEMYGSLLIEFLEDV